MEREIKFRAWDKVKQTMVYNFPIIATAPYGINDAFKLLAEKGEDSVAIMQYTGLKDKNGKEIYEGDIVNHDQENFSGGVNVIINWSRGGFYCGYANHIPVAEILNRGAEVIGNIYENPELLESNSTNK